MKHKTRNMKYIADSGYIALISTIILALAMMAVIFGISLSGFFSRFNISDSYAKEVSGALSESCVSTALVNLAQNSSYAGNEIVQVENDTCTIFPIETAGSEKIVKTKAVFGRAHTNFKVIVSSSDLSIISWEELPNL